MALEDAAVIGPTVEWHQAAVSYARALAVHRLAGDGTIAVGGLTVADDHAVALLLAADRGWCATSPGACWGR